jgi:hypothetical protein
VEVERINTDTYVVGGQCDYFPEVSHTMTHLSEMIFLKVKSMSEKANPNSRGKSEYLLLSVVASNLDLILPNVRLQSESGRALRAFISLLRLYCITLCAFAIIARRTVTHKHVFYSIFTPIHFALAPQKAAIEFLAPKQRTDLQEEDLSIELVPPPGART